MILKMLLRCCLSLVVAILCVILTVHEVSAVSPTCVTESYGNDAQKMDTFWKEKCKDGKFNRGNAEDAATCEKWNKYKPCQEPGPGSVCQVTVRNLKKNNEKFCSKESSCNVECPPETACTETTAEHFCMKHKDDKQFLCDPQSFTKNGRIVSISTCEPLPPPTTTVPTTSVPPRLTTPPIIIYYP